MQQTFWQSKPNGSNVLEMDVLKVGIMALPLLDIDLNESDSASGLLLCPSHLSQGGESRDLFWLFCTCIRTEQIRKLFSTSLRNPGRDISFPIFTRKEIETK